MLAIFVFDDRGAVYSGMIREGDTGDDIKAYDSGSPQHRRLLSQNQNSETLEIIRKGNNFPICKNNFKYNFIIVL